MNTETTTEPKTLTLSFRADDMGAGTPDELCELAAYCDEVAEAVCERAGIVAEVTERKRGRPSDKEAIIEATIFDACCAHPEDSDAAIDMALRALGYSTEV